MSYLYFCFILMYKRYDYYHYYYDYYINLLLLNRKSLVL